MHFLMGVFWLFLVMLMIALYVGIAYLLFMMVRWLRAKKRTKLAIGWDDDPVPFWLSVDFKRLRAACIIIVAASMTAYFSQRAKWMGEDNANLQAKEYWVAGQVLNGFRHALTTVIHPDVFIMWPAESLQRLIYRQGTGQLPENDGEIGVWQNVWFNYHYIKKGRRNLGVNTGESSDKMRQILDQWWFSLEAMGSRSFADKEMEEEHYLRDYPALAFWYRMYVGFYTKKLIASAHRLAKLPKHVDRYRRLSTWLWELSTKWQSSPKAQNFNATHPKVVALAQTALIRTLQSLIQGEIYAGKFSCTNASIQRYIEARKDFIKKINGLPTYKTIGDREQGERLWRIAIDSFGARSAKYVIKHYCGIDVAGKEDNNKREYIEIGKLHNRSPEEQADYGAKVNWDDENKILEEQFDER